MGLRSRVVRHGTGGDLPPDGHDADPVRPDLDHRRRCRDSPGARRPVDQPRITVTQMPTVYKNTRGQHAVRQWCVDAIARAAFPLATATVDTSAGRISLTSAGTGRTRRLGARHRLQRRSDLALARGTVTPLADDRGRPARSARTQRSAPARRARLTWYGRILAEVLEAIDAERVVLVGNSLGAAVALAADSSRIAGRALISPAGFMRLSLDPNQRSHRRCGCCSPQPNTPVDCSGCSSPRVRSRPKPRWSG